MSKEKKSNKKEMKITLLSKPLKTDASKVDQSLTSKPKPKDIRKKGTKGPSWIGWKTNNFVKFIRFYIKLINIFKTPKKLNYTFDSSNNLNLSATVV